MPSTRAHQQGRGFFLQAIWLSLGAGIFNSAINGIMQVNMALDITLPGGGMGVFEIGHEYFGARVQGVDNHFSFHGAGDLYTAVQEIMRDGSYSPLTVADMLGFGEKIG